MEKKNDYVTIKKIHTMCFLLSMKVQRVFNSRVIHTIMDKNWDMKGMKDVLNQIFTIIGLIGCFHFIGETI